MKRLATLLALLAACALSRAARADTEQDNRLTFGLQGAWIPAQHDLDGDVAAIGPYVAFAHDIEFVELGVRLALLYGWLPSGETGQQYVVEPDLFVGARARLGRVALGLQLGTGELLNGGEGFPFTPIWHAYLRGEVQWRFTKSALLELSGGPTFVLGSSVVGVFPEIALGAGWAF